jgi:hypothetical protein
MVFISHIIFIVLKECCGRWSLGVVLAGRFVPGRSVPGSSFLGVALTGSGYKGRCGYWEPLGALGSLDSRSPLRCLRLPRLVTYLRVAGQVFRGCFKYERGSVR